MESILKLKTNFCYWKKATPDASGEAIFTVYKIVWNEKTWSE